jgi:C4-dicarboxylate-specific signal transduction histidine kinase
VEILLVLALLACPVGMGLMMWLMGRGRGWQRQRGQPAAGAAELRGERARLSAEIERRERDGTRAPAAGSSS